MDETYKQSLNSSNIQTSYKEHLYALIICGGAGTRLWPRSRQKTPKQFLEKFYGEKTLFRQTVDRALLLTNSNRIFVVTIGDYADEIIKYAPEIPSRNIIAEPFGKNTAMAVGVGATYIEKIDPKAIIMTFWSDAAIKDNKIFSEKLSVAVKAALTGDFMVTVGLKPTFPHTGLGYIETGEKISGDESEVCKVISFREKPDLTLAEEFVKKGNFYWNTGIFVCSVESLLKAFSFHSPEIYRRLQEISSAIQTSNEREILLKAYESAENVAIDTAIWEKAKNLLLVPASFSWSDIGDWKVVYDLKEKDPEGNIIEAFGEKGWHLGVETNNCLIETDNRLVATVGVSDLVIIETDDAVLICHKDKAQGVKKIVEALKEKGRKEYL